MNDKKKLRLISRRACLIELFNNDTVQFLARKKRVPCNFHNEVSIKRYKKKERKHHRHIKVNSIE